MGVSHGHNNAPIKSTNKWTRRLKMPAINTVALGNHPIQIPSDFPGILEQYTKAAIRTQPRDLLLWSAAYFRCLANGESPPAKDRLEYPVPSTDTGLTPGLLRVIHKQVGHSTKVTAVTLSEKWKGVCLHQQDLDHLLLDGGWKRGEVDWLKFVGLATMTISDGIQNTIRVSVKYYQILQMEFLPTSSLKPSVRFTPIWQKGTL